MFADTHTLAAVDPEIWQAIRDEYRRQEDGLELIASENYASPAVMAAQGTVLTNKYAEGYPGKRYYGGCEFVDVAERLAIERVKKLFGAEYANVQPHSGSQANQAVYMAMLKPGDTILGMSLAHGGHLTHGAAVNLSGKLYHSVAYGLSEAEEIDYDQVRDLAREFNPRMIVAGASAYALRADWQQFRDIADEVGAMLMVDMAHYAGLVAAGLYPNPVGIADFVTSTTHKTLRGPRGGIILAAAEHEKALNSAIFPSHPGRAAHARDRRQGRRLQGGARARVQGLPGAGPRERAGHGRRRSRSAACASSPGAPKATSSSWTCAPRRSPARMPRPRWARRTSR